jgi:hypothetical protein
MPSADSLNYITSGLTTTNWVTIGGFGIPILGALILLIFRSGKIIEKINTIDKRGDHIEKRVDNIDARVDSLWKHTFSISKSPMQLNDKGLKVLNESGIKTIVELRYPEIFQQVKAMNPTNAYQVQEFTREVVSKLQNDVTLKDQLEMGAFKSGFDVYTVLFSGALFIRDRILVDLGFDVDDIDKHEPKIS